MNLFDKVKHIPQGLQTLKEWLDDGGVTVDPITAQRRADICLKCPKNQPGGVLSPMVAKAVKRHLEIKARLKLRVSGEKNLRECQVCRCQMRLKIWVPIGIVKRGMTTEEFEHFPTPCWQRDETP